MRERVEKLERLNAVNKLPFQKPVKSVATETVGVVRDRTAGRRARIEAAAAELLNPTVPIEQVGSEAFAKEKEQQSQRSVREIIRPPPPPPPEELAPPSESSRDTTEDIRGNERIGTERIVGDHRGSFRALRERMERRGSTLIYGTEADRYPPTPAQEESSDDPDILAAEVEIGMEMGLRPKEITTRLGKLSADMYGVPYSNLRRGQRVKVRDAFKRGGGV